MMLCVHPWKRTDIKGSVYGFPTVPCGVCPLCRRNNVDLWSTRAQYEFCRRVHASFVTLTYDDYQLPFSPVLNVPSLRRNHFSRYMKTLKNSVRRIDSSVDFSYFGCGEYGDKFNRPHYHVLCFGLDHELFNKVLVSAWSNRGYVKILPVLTGAIKYVMKYFNKNVVGSLASEIYDSKGLERPFIASSKGFGSDFFYLHRDDISKKGFISLSGNPLIPVPSYYKSRFFNWTDEISRARCSKEFSDRVLRESRDCHFSSPDDYIAYKNRIKCESLANKMMLDNSPVLREFLPQSFSFDSYALALTALCD